MEGANSATNWTVGCTKDLPLQVGDVMVKVHTHVIEQASFGLLLGCPFQQATLCHFKDMPNSKVEISVCDQADLSQRVLLSTCPCTRRAPGVKIISVHTPSPPPMLPHLLSPSPLMQNIEQHPLLPLPPAKPATLALKYKCINKKVQPIPATLPEEYRTVCCIPVDPLLSLPPLLTLPPDFMPDEHLTQEHLDDLKLNLDNFLWPEEVKLVQHVLKLNKCALAWTEVEKGRFRDDYFSPVKIPVIKHVPWAHKNLPIPLGILNEVTNLFKEKIAVGMYERSDTSYRSCWFCVKKKNGSLRLIHDLQPLNAITISNSGIVMGRSTRPGSGHLTITLSDLVSFL